MKLASLVLVLGLGFANSVFATQAMQKIFIERYPQLANTQLNSCATCHSPAVAGFVNQYGADLQTAKLDFAAIEATDSDGDGKSNLDEITALTWPGSRATDSELLIFPASTGKVTFNHGAHQTDAKYGIMGNCAACHNAAEPLHFAKIFNDTVSIKDKAHATCKACHVAAANPAAPTKCKECHVKD